MANDAVALSHLTGVSPQLVGATWLAISVVYFLFIMRITVKPVTPIPSTGRTRPAEA
jgi:hypothetical protein